MLIDQRQLSLTSKGSKLFQQINRSIIMVLASIIIISLTITTITFAMLWNRSKSSSNYMNSVHKGTIGYPIRLPNDGKYIQWTFLQLNDVYEMLPLDQGRKGGLARVARVRQLLLEENPRTYTVLVGDFLSPSALSQSEINGTILNGRQMIASMDTLGIDFVIFGNHEFDLDERELISRINESKFSWISTNVYKSGTDQPFSSTIRYKILTIDKINILLIGLTINVDRSYIRIINQTSLIPFVQQFLKSISNIEYDVLVALTHLSLKIDIQLAENIPEIDLILGGHEHENYFLSRGVKYTPITKADANAFTVYIHRCAFNLDTKRFLVYQTLTQINSEIEDEPKTAEVANYWYDLGMKGFQQIGLQPNKTVSCLPSNIELDGRSTSIRNFPTLLTDCACQSILKSTSINGTKIAVFVSGSIRIDDILRGTITQYDILRVFPLKDDLWSLSVPGSYLAKVLTSVISLKGTGRFPAYCGIQTLDQGNTWIVDDLDISKTNLNYTIATMTYLKDAELNNPAVTIMQHFNITQRQSLMEYLPLIYPPCRHLGGVMTMQCRLSSLKHDMADIQSKFDQLETEASILEKYHSDKAKSIGEQTELLKFLRDLDHFSTWLTRTQASVASEDIPNTLNEAEQLLNQHQTIKEEIDCYGPGYAQMKEYGHRIICNADTTDPKYIFLRERLNALYDNWNELDQMWHHKKNMLTEAMQYQMFIRDSNQAEILLNHQEAYLAREQQPKSLDDVEVSIKKHKDFFTTMSANGDQI
ncbi:unnamed protein product [Rotaria sp. Silwood1]|nr:unnamed protein product [Rotaria sp. Silwood1]CAF1596835.1 unnamed protein product [Rotaria sp. Silwood1]